MAPTLGLTRRREERCREARARPSDYIDGELGFAERRRIERHLRRCPRCRRVLAGLTMTVSGLRRLGRRDPRLIVPDRSRGRPG
jgi:anti-sigma factor RsiW